MILSHLAYALASWFGNWGLKREIQRREHLPAHERLWHNYYGWGRDYDPTLPYPPR